MTQLRIAEGLTLPIEAVTEKLGFLGRTGSGKTYAAMKLAEEMHRAGAQFVALDPVGKWWGLRLAADGRAPGIAIPVFGGLHGDVPLEPTAGRLVADLIADRSISVVLDVSQFESDTDKARFAGDFAERFFFRKKANPSAVHLFIEEAQEFVPQNPQREEAKMLHRFTRYVKLGRNFGLGCSLISQRPQEVNKKVLNQTELLFAFQMTGPQERKTLEGWIAEKGIDEDIAGELPKLRQGAPHVWSPAWLSVSKVVKILPKRTYDASSTPKVGAKAVEAELLAPIDLEKIKKEMAATIEKAKAEDPRELRKQIAHLKSELTVANKKVQPEPGSTVIQKEIERVEIPALSPKDQRSLEEAADRIREEAMAGLNAFRTAHQEAQQTLAHITGLIDSARSLAAARPLPSRTTQAHPAPRPAPRSPRATTRGALDRGERSGELGKAERAILGVLAQHSDGCAKGKLSLLAGYRYSGGFRNSLSELRTRGYIIGGNDQIMSITAEGMAAIEGAYEPLPTGQELVDYWLNHRSLGRAEKAIFGVITDEPGRRFTADELAKATGYEYSGGFRNALSNLRTAGLLVGSNTGEMQASEELFG